MGEVGPQCSLKLKAEVEIADGCYAVCSHGGFTYVAGSSSISKVNEADWSVKYFVEEAEVRNITCCGDSLFVLAGDYYYYVRVYSLKTGKLVKSFPHRPSDAAEISSQTLAVVPGKVVIPDNIQGRMTIYSPKGRIGKHVPCLQLDPGGYAQETSICVADKDSVVASCADSSTVMRIDVSQRKVVWTSKEVEEPAFVACYGGEYVIVAGNEPDQTEMFIMDINTGEFK